MFRKVNKYYRHISNQINVKYIISYNGVIAYSLFNCAIALEKRIKQLEITT